MVSQGTLSMPHHYPCIWHQYAVVLRAYTRYFQQILVTVGAQPPVTVSAARQKCYNVRKWTFGTFAQESSDFARWELRTTFLLERSGGDNP